MARRKGQKYNLSSGGHRPLQRTKYQTAYFFIDGDLYRTIKNDRANNLCRAWSFIDKKIMDFPLSEVRTKSQQAFGTKEVAKMLNRSKSSILKAVTLGAINPPVKIGEIKYENEFGSHFGHYKWSEDDVYALHEYYLTLGKGRPRKDGMISAAPRCPTRLELVAMMKQQRMYYVQDADGNFVPIFDQPDWT